MLFNIHAGTKNVKSVPCKPQPFLLQENFHEIQNPLDKGELSESPFYAQSKKSPAKKREGGPIILGQIEFFVGTFGQVEFYSFTSIACLLMENWQAYNHYRSDIACIACIN